MEGFKQVGRISGVGIPPPFIHNARMPEETLSLLLERWDGNWLDIGGGTKTISAEEVYNRGIKGLSRLVKRRNAKIIIEAATEQLQGRPYGLPESFPERGVSQRRRRKAKR